MQSVLADHQVVPELRLFFRKYVDLSNDGVYNQEFICPDGIKASTQRRQVIVAIDEEQVIEDGRSDATRKRVYGG